MINKILNALLYFVFGLLLLIELGGCTSTFPRVQDTRTATPTTAPTATAEPTATLAPTPTVACLIKGNVNPKGEKFYHLLGSRYYNQTIVEPAKGDKWFCTEQDAINAGFKKPAR